MLEDTCMPRVEKRNQLVHLPGAINLMQNIVPSQDVLESLLAVWIVSFAYADA